VFAVSTLVLPRVLRRFGPERTAFAGLILLAVAHLMLATVDHGDPYALGLLPALVLAAVGVAFSFTPSTLVIAEGMAARNAGVSSGLASSTAQLGGALGIAVFGALDAANRVAVLSGGGSQLSAAEAGLSAAHVAAAGAAAAGAVVAVLAFPALRRTIPSPRRARGDDRLSSDELEVGEFPARGDARLREDVAQVEGNRPR
jgi:MFS family permease